MTTPTSTTPTQWYQLYASVYTLQSPVSQCLMYSFNINTTTSVIGGVYTVDGTDVLIQPSSTFNPFTLQFSSQGIVIYDTELPISSTNPNQYVFETCSYLKFNGSDGSGNRIYAYTVYPTQGYYLKTSIFTIIPVKQPSFLNLIENANRWNGIPDNAYQIQKQIQNTVRIPTSLYIDNLSSLSIYQYPVDKQKVNWNQMSDRAVPHNQKTSTSGTNSVRGTVTRCRPNAGCPGGSGCDVKHNSYARYLGRLKGKRLLSQNSNIQPPPVTVPSSAVIFNPAFPVYGNKLYSTNIITSVGVVLPQRSSYNFYKSFYNSFYNNNVK